MGYYTKSKSFAAAATPKNLGSNCLMTLLKRKGSANECSVKEWHDLAQKTKEVLERAGCAADEILFGGNPTVVLSGPKRIGLHHRCEYVKLKQTCLSMEEGLMRDSGVLQASFRTAAERLCSRPCFFPSLGYVPSPVRHSDTLLSAHGL
ncbi:hypothetical protein NDU88_002353 [Pleurodeles waltl]|uniref:Uncharacterized protein n=1 Tax=Pleurodeles waltl TaxID=8319 RepID=A0AAV7SCQ3_PLEWA|nr:hypothetical protein NDU88_002353 [Pleurodeles waltl]